MTEYGYPGTNVEQSGKQQPEAPPGTWRDTREETNA